MASLVHDHKTKIGRKIVVIDYAIAETMGQFLYEYFNHYALWGFGGNEDNKGDNVPFICLLDNGLIQHSPLWEELQKYVKKFFGSGYIPYNCSVNHTRFGDSPMDHRDTHDEIAKDITLLLYLNPYWNLNFSGETVYFDEQGEIELSLLPKFCRLAIHEGFIRHTSRAPGRLFAKSRFTLAIKATPDVEYLKKRLEDEAPEADNKAWINRKNFLEQSIFGGIETKE
jgi:hypothetical protein